MSTLADFLLARIAEDEEDICHCCDAGLDTRSGFARAECEAKRRITRRLSALIGDADRDSTHEGTTACANMAEELLAMLALPYADHPDYRQEWKP